jgi:DNA polymerase
MTCVVFQPANKMETNVTIGTVGTGIELFQQDTEQQTGDVGGVALRGGDVENPMPPQLNATVLRGNGTNVTALPPDKTLKNLDTGVDGAVGDVCTEFIGSRKTNISYLDIETHSNTNLELSGPSAYVEHPTTQLLVVAYALDDQPVRTWQPGQPVPDDLLTAIAGGCRVSAHNFGFDKAVWHRLLVPLGWPAIPLDRWTCTAFRARLARLPAGLEVVARVLRLPWQKDAAGKKFMRSLIKRDLKTHPLTEEERDRLAAYCVIDVETLRALDCALPEIPDEWRELFELDHVMNTRGMPVNLDVVRRLVVVRDAENKRLQTRFRQVSGLNSLDQIQALRQRLADLGVELPDLQHETLETWLTDNPDRHDLPAELIRLRWEFAHAANTKLDRMLAAGVGSGRIRDGFVLHGAHTGRWAGIGVQLQNLPRTTLDDADAVLAALCHRADQMTAGRVDFPLPVSIKEAIASCLRGVFEAPDGWVFVSVDLSQIEARVLCWLAGQNNVLGEFARGDDVYLRTAERLGSNGGSRSLGKLFVLSAGYGASGRVMHQRAPGYGVTLTVDQAYELTERWRSINRFIVGFWHELFHTQCVCVELPADQPPFEFNRFRIWRTPETLFVQLPSSRCLKYHKPELIMSERGSLALQVHLPKNGQFLPVTLWHGTVTENVVSGIATDLLMNAMVQLHRDDVFLVGSIHDELVALAPVEDAEAIKVRMIEVLQTPPDWADGLPLAAEGFINARFIEPPSSAAHAPLAPSAAHRWIACPGSVMAERLAPSASASAFAEEGTEAHRIFAECLVNSVPVASLTSDSSLIDPLRHALFLAADVIAGRDFKVEQRLAPLPGMPEIWGTADVIIFDQHGRVVALIDLKFGAGIAVEADTIQLQIYALLAAQQYGASPDGVTVHIIQPRREHVRGPLRSHHLTTEALGQLVDRLNTAVQATEAPDAPRIAGTWCQFCAAAVSCPEHHNQPPKRRTSNPWELAGELA